MEKLTGKPRATPFAPYLGNSLMAFIGANAPEDQSTWIDSTAAGVECNELLHDVAGLPSCTLDAGQPVKAEAAREEAEQ
jgi:hypothetical protein